MRPLSALAAMAAFGSWIAAADWPQFRGPSANGLAGQPLPLAWDGASGRNILWKTPIPGLAHSSPIVWGDRIYLTSAVSATGAAILKTGLYGDIQPVEDEGAQEFRVYAIDRKSGRILWQRTAYRGAPRIKRHPKSTHANPTPATDGVHLAAFFGSEGLYVYDLEGKLLWKKDFGVLDGGFFQVTSAQWGFASSPVIHDGKLLIQADVQKGSFLAALDIRTGRELWRTPRQDVPTFSTPAVVPYTADGKKSLQVVANGWKQIAGYSLDDGRELWRLTGGGDIPVPTPIFAAGLVLITNAHGSARPIYAVRTDVEGDITGKAKSIAWRHDRAGNYMQTPLASDGLGYFCFDNGVLSVFQLATGERVYQQRLGSGNSGYTASPVAGGGKLYVTSEDGLTHIIEMGATFREAARNELGEPVMATPAAAGGILYMRGRSHLYAIGSR